MVVDVVVDKCTGGITLVRPLVVVQRGEVVKRRAPGRQLTGGRVEVLSPGFPRGRVNLPGVVESGHEGGGRATASQCTDPAHGGAGERAVAVVALGLENGRDAPIPCIGGSISPAVGKVAAGDHAEVAPVAVGGVAAGCGKAKQRVGGLSALVAVVVLIEAVVALEAHALEVVVDHEVDHAGDGVGAVHSGGTAGQEIDPLDQARGDLVEVGSRVAVLRRVAGHQTTPIDQHQGAIGAQVAQRHGRLTGGAVGVT